jgi:hypothetical protein
MIRHRGWLVLVGLGVALSARPARGQLYNEEAVGRLRIGGTIGGVLSSMSAVNDNFGVVNAALNLDEIRSLDKVNVSLLTALEVRYRLGRTPKEDPDEPHRFLDRFTLGFAWGALEAGSKIDNIQRVYVNYWSRATTYYPYVLYELPFFEKSQPRLETYVGGGPYFLSSGFVDWTLTDHTTNSWIGDKQPGVADISELAGTAQANGSATGAVLQAGIQFMLNKRFSVSTDLGYRWADMKDIIPYTAEGQDTRFPGDPSLVRRPDDWSVIDFFLRNRDAVYDGERPAHDEGIAEGIYPPGPWQRDTPKSVGGCETCPLYYTGDTLDVDFSGPFATVSFWIHF